MTATGVDRFQELLSRRAAKGPRPPQGLAPHIKYRFGAGNPDPGSFPYSALAQATAEVMEDEGAQALSYGGVFGYEALREWVCHKHKVFEDLDITPDNVLITNGSGDALGLVIQTFVDEGDAVITEAPTFSATLQTFRRNGADLHGVEVDAEGMRTDILAEKLEAIKRSGRQCKLIYTIDNFQNPAGPTLTLKRRHELLDLAKQYGVIVLEDDAYGELRFEGEQLPSLFALDDAGLVARTGTLSKILGAGTRVGWVIAQPSLVPYLSSFNYGGGVAPFMSRICYAYMKNNLETHVEELRRVYKEKRDAMISELEAGLAGTDAFWHKPEGGFFLWIKLPTGTDPKRLMELASAAGVGYVPGPAFMPNGGGENYIRLAFSQEAPDELRAGTRLICKAIHEARS
ncbi:MAG: PLP-dependent aminotransferase family protein [Chloroflexota bacterium]